MRKNRKKITGLNQVLFVYSKKENFPFTIQVKLEIEVKVLVDLIFHLIFF